MPLNNKEANVNIIVGSMLGASEYVAEALETLMKAEGYQVEVHLKPNLSDISLESVWIICTSTHGAGDLPDNIQPFAKQISNIDLGTVNYFVVGLGDTNYDTYCFAAKHFEDLLQKGNAKQITAPLYIDVAEHSVPETVASQWMQDWLDKINE